MSVGHLYIIDHFYKQSLSGGLLESKVITMLIVQVSIASLLEYWL